MTAIQIPVVPEQLRHYAERVEQALRTLLPDEDNARAAKLAAAMRHTTLLGGKRIRAALVYAFGEAYDAPAEALDLLAAALECIHAYSLVHDDLPCMDDDDVRRGLPTVHKKWDEATAVLTGDALLTLAFELVSRCQPYIPASTCVEILLQLSEASGINGMIGGQMLDLEQSSDLSAIHSRKTGALIVASCTLGALAGGQPNNSLQPVREFATNLGLLFQIVDDILDATQDSYTLGKTSGKDAAQNKNTYVRQLGLEGARNSANKCYGHTVDALAELALGKKNNGFLEALTHFVYKRTS